MQDSTAKCSCCGHALGPEHSKNIHFLWLITKLHVTWLEVATVSPSNPKCIFHLFIPKMSVLSSLIFVKNFEGALSLVKSERMLWNYGLKSKASWKKLKKITYFKAGIIFSNMVNSLKHLSEIFRWSIKDDSDFKGGFSKNELLLIWPSFQYF